jgi:hypothetical protein
MTKVKNNAAEIVLTIVTIVILMSSCGGNNYTCPSYAYNTTGAGADWTEGIDELK